MRSDDDQLPAHLREKVEKLRHKGKAQQDLVARLLERRANASPEERRQVDEMLVSLTRTSRAGYLFALIPLLVIAILGYHFVSLHNYDEAVLAGVPTVARVKQLDPGDCTLGQKGYRCLRLTLEVHPLGRAPYTAVLTHDIDMQWMSRVQPGSWLTVAVDAQEPSKLYFDERSMAVEAPAPPAAGRGE